MKPLVATDFEKQPRGPYRFDLWVARQRVSTALGTFTVGLQMLGKDDTGPPDDEMLSRANELTNYAEVQGEYILDVVYGHYLFAAQQPNWLETWGVPRGLSRDVIANYLREDRSLVVSRHLNWKEAYNSVIFVIPLWDEEHALILDFRNGAIVAANDLMFTLESGVLRWVQNKPDAGTNR